MATKRKYAYYIKGNKIAIIEEGMGAGVCSLSGYNTQTTCEDAGGTWTENASGVNDVTIEVLFKQLLVDWKYSMLIAQLLIFNQQVQKVLTFIGL